MPIGRPKSAAKDKRTEAVQALLTPEERTAFDELVTQMTDELGIGTMADGVVLRRLILVELKRRGLYPPGEAKPSAQPNTAATLSARGMTPATARGASSSSAPTTPGPTRGAKSARLAKRTATKR